MVQIIYASAATEPFTPAALRALLVKARLRNTFYNVSGMLLYHRGSFLQVLEGPAEGVTTIHQSILRDPRHHNVRTLLERSTGTREFENWSMGFADANTLNPPPGLLEYNRELRTVIDAAGRARQFLRFFQEGLYRQHAGTSLP